MLCASLGTAALMTLSCGRHLPDRFDVTIIGIDGASWRVIDPLLAEGELPHVARLLAEGVGAPLQSRRPLVSPAVWTTIATGVPRNRHGIRSFRGARGGLVSSRDRRVPALWTQASAAGIRTAVIGWWATYPAEQIDGAIISERALKIRDADLQDMFRGRLSAIELGTLVYPPEIADLVGEVLATPQAPGGQERYTPEAQRDRMRAEDDAIVDALARLRARMGPFGLEMVLLRGVDVVSHFFWKFHEPDAAVYPEAERPTPDEVARYGRTIADHYRHVDALLSTLGATGSRSHVVVLLSDHGFEAGRQRFHHGLLSGTHKSDAALYGILVAAGGPLRRGVRLAEASILDVAPTVLHLLGLPIPGDVAGAVLTEALEPVWLQAHPEHRSEASATAATKPSAGPTGEQDDDTRSPTDKLMEKELKALGYIE